jgi:hypothetical protein
MDAAGWKCAFCSRRVKDIYNGYRYWLRDELVVCKRCWADKTVSAECIAHWKKSFLT